MLERERDSTPLGSTNSADDEMDMENAFRTLLVEPNQRQVISMQIIGFYLVYNWLLIGLYGIHDTCHHMK